MVYILHLVLYENNKFSEKFCQILQNHHMYVYDHYITGIILWHVLRQDELSKRRHFLQWGREWGRVRFLNLGSYDNKGGGREAAQTPATKMSQLMSRVGREGPPFSCFISHRSSLQQPSSSPGWEVEFSEGSLCLLSELARSFQKNPYVISHHYLQKKDPQIFSQPFFYWLTLLNFITPTLDAIVQPVLAALTAAHWNSQESSPRPADNES